MNKKFKMVANMALVTQIGVSMIVPIFGGVYFGHWLDEKVGTKLIFLLVFTILGVGAAFSSLFKLATKGINKRK